MQFYNKTFPDIDEIVMIRYDNIAKDCVYVTLLEYNIQGIITFKELSKRRLRTRYLKQAAPIGKTAPAVVCEDSNDSNLSLTTKRLTDDEVKEFSKKFSKNKKIISIIENISHNIKINFKDLFQKIVHPLNKIYVDEGDSETVYDLINDNIDDFTYMDCLNLEDHILEEYKKIILKIFTKPDEKIQLKMAIVSNIIEGINITRDILVKYEQEYPDIVFYLEKTPYYLMEKMSSDVKTDLEKFDTISKELGAYIIQNGGNFKVIK